MTTSKPVVSRVNWEPLHEVVYRELREAILSAKYAPGTTLTVRSTSDHFGVSAMPVRAAFARLIAERAVESTSNGTVIIPGMTRSRFDDLVEMRILLEGTATEKAATHISAKRLRRLSALSRQIEEAVASKSTKYLALNRQFKFDLYEAAEAPVLLDLIERLWLRIGPFMNYYGRDITAQAQTDAYDDIVAALQKGDGVAARRANELDISEGAAFLREMGEFLESPQPE